jgi:hypothetical protein
MLGTGKLTAGNRTYMTDGADRTGKRELIKKLSDLKGHPIDKSKIKM